MNKYLKKAICLFTIVTCGIIHAETYNNPARYNDGYERRGLFRHRYYDNDRNWAHPVDAATGVADTAYDLATAPLRAFGG